MLGPIEGKLTALVAELVAARGHLSVQRAPGPLAALQAGAGAVLVSVAAVTPLASFELGRRSFEGTESRRVLPLQLAAKLEFFVRPLDASAGALAAARDLLLDDLSIVSHGLADDRTTSGGSFAVSADDPGFRVRAFSLESGEVARDLAGTNLAGSLRYRALGEIWPPGAGVQVGEIRAIDTVLVSLPLEIERRELVARSGQSTLVRVRSLGAARLVQREPRQAELARLAVTVSADVAPAERGSIAGGAPGAETGFRIIELTPPETSIRYQAPASVNRSRLEYVAIHLATPDGQRGAFLGSVAVRLES